MAWGLEIHYSEALANAVRGDPLASALATYVHRVLTCRGDTPTLDLVRQVEWWEGAMAEPVRARRLSDEEGPAAAADRAAG